MEMDIRGNWDRLSPSTQQWLTDDPEMHDPAANHGLPSSVRETGRISGPRPARDLPAVTGRPRLHH